MIKGERMSADELYIFFIISYFIIGLFLSPVTAWLIFNKDHKKKVRKPIKN